MPTEPCVKLWYAVIVVYFNMVMWNDDRIAVALLPVAALLFFLIIYGANVFFNPSLDTYGNRIGLFWAFFNGAMLSNIYCAFAAININPEFYNTTWPMCYDMAGSIYTKEFADCFMA